MNEAALITYMRDLDYTLLECTSDQIVFQRMIDRSDLRTFKTWDEVKIFIQNY